MYVDNIVVVYLCRAMMCLCPVMADSHLNRQNYLVWRLLVLC